MHAGLMIRTLKAVSLTTVFFTLAVLAGSLLPAVAQQNQPAVHPFVPPPVMEETTPAAPAMQFLRFTKTTPAQPCHPRGTVRRAGNDVWVKLDFVRAPFVINNPDPSDPYDGNDPVELRSFGGCNSGPTIEVLPGNTLHIDLNNKLSTDDPSCLPNPPSGLALPPGVGCFNTMNLHTHGLHVSPTGNSDNVLLSIAPNTGFPYEINIPGDHPAGTFWYHSHRHGSTAVGVASGASGILVIRGTRPYTEPTADNPHPIADIDTILHDRSGTPFTEQLFLLQQIPYACFDNDPSFKGGLWQQIFTTYRDPSDPHNLKKSLFNVNNAAIVAATGPQVSPWTCPKPDDENHASIGVVENFALQMFSASIWDTNGRFTTVNGVVQPALTVKAGEIQRWRFVHAGIHDTINLQVVRYTPTPKLANLIATSSLVGNRLQQVQAVEELCVASPSTLIPQFEIAVDGLTRTHLQKIGDGGENVSNYMQPGYRSDVLVVFPSDGDYCLLDQAAPKSQRFDPSTGNGGGQGPNQPQLLAYVHVRGGQAIPAGPDGRYDLQAYIEKTLYDANPTKCPEVKAGSATDAMARVCFPLTEPVRQKLLQGDLKPWAPFIELPPPPAANKQTAAFSILPGGLFQMQMNSDPWTAYSPDVVNVTRQVNTSDDWMLTAYGEPHIFHIHVNPFEVIDVQYLDPNNPNAQWTTIFDREGHCIKADPEQLQNQYCSMYHTFRDTVVVLPNYRIQARTYYDRYIGEFVIHCHILDHEDAGMMVNINIVPDLKAPGGGLGMAGMHHTAQ